MLYLRKSLDTWQSDPFNATLKQEIESLSLDQLPLQQVLQLGSMALEDGIQATILKIEETTDSIRVNVGIFFNSVIAGCNCADDPTPIDMQNEYAEMRFIIDKQSAETRIELIPETD